MYGRKHKLSTHVHKTPIKYRAWVVHIDRAVSLEQKFVEFVAKTEAVIGGSLPAQCGVVCNTGVDVDKAVKEAISVHDEKLCIILLFAAAVLRKAKSLLNSKMFLCAPAILLLNALIFVAFQWRIQE